MAASAYERLGLIELGELSQHIVGPIRDLLALLIGWVGAVFKLEISVIFIELGGMYLSIGNAMVRSEQSELMSEYSFERQEGVDQFLEGLKTARVDTWLPAMPGWLRGLFIRAFWPVIAAHRLHTPYVIEGPGPGDDFISSAVPANDLASFTAMVEEAGKLEQQKFYDHRQVIAWQIIFGFGLAFLLSIG